MSALTPPIEISVNGQLRQLSLSPDTAVLTVLRQDLGLMGTRVGCTEGHCGACTVLLDGRPVQSCNLPLWSVAGHSLRTIEGVAASNGAPGLVQHAFLDEQAGQCGYCINGIMMTVTGMLEQTPPATRHEILQQLDERHLCRCGAQPRILRAIDRAIAMAAARRQEAAS
jgi:aerobic-type carbon monoxide dehydrogenase small subunit (CoxS/CutS family)